MTATGSSASIWQIVSSLATSIAVIIALFRDVIVRFWSRPRLTLRAAPESSSLSQVYVLSNRSEVWQLMLVANEGRRESAEDVEVIVLDVVKLAGKSLKRVTSDPIVKNYALKWSLVPTSRLRIGAGTQRWIDLVYALELPRISGRPAERRLCLPAKVDPWPPLDREALDPAEWETEGHVLRAGAYRFHLAIVSAGTRARHFDVDVHLENATRKPELRAALHLIRITKRR